MKYRKLGRTGLEVSQIGFGAWGIGGTHEGHVAYGATDDAESKKALKLALDLGITFYDTSDHYGYGHSEELIGEAFEGVRDRVVIATKGGFPKQGAPQDFSPKNIRESIEKSLKRLRTDYVDLYQLHSPSLDELRGNPAILETFNAIQKEGKARAIGISTRSPDDAIAAIKEFKAACIQVNLNLIDQRILANGLLELCEKEKVGVIARTPLCYGFLSGKYEGDIEFDSKDQRSQWSVEQRKTWAQAYRLFVKEMEGTTQTPAQIALRFCLSYYPVSTTIPGMLNREQVRENAAAGGLDGFEKEIRMKFETVYKSHSFFVSSGAKKV